MSHEAFLPLLWEAGEREHSRGWGRSGGRGGVGVGVSVGVGVVGSEGRLVLRKSFPQLVCS
jgi:hypothetical protein